MDLREWKRLTLKVKDAVRKMQYDAVLRSNVSTHLGLKPDLRMTLFREGEGTMKIVFRHGWLDFNKETDDFKESVERLEEALFKEGF